MAADTITLKGNVPSAPLLPTGATIGTLNVSIPSGSGPSGSNGNGESTGFMSVQVNKALLSAWVAGDCTITLTQP